MKQTILRYKTKVANKKNKSNKPFIPFSKTKEIGILINLTENTDTKAINHFIQNLKKENKNVSVLVYTPENHNNPFDFKFKGFTKKDISITGKINSAEVTQFISKKFDFIFSLNKQELMPFNYILATNQSGCRVGCYLNDEVDYLDLIIHPKESETMDKTIAEMLNFANKIH